MILDIFNNEAFKLRSLTMNINKIPPMFSYLGSVPGLFSEVGSSTTTIAVEEQEGTLSLVPNSQRGTQGNALPYTPRKVRPFTCFHKQINDQILADQVQGVRRFGSETEMETVAQKVAEKLEKAANAMEITLEKMRAEAVKGRVCDADGTVITDMFKEFEQKPYTETWDLSKMDLGGIKKKCSNLLRRTMQVLGGTPLRAIEILCGDDIFDAIETSEEIREANKWRNNSDFLVDSHAYRYFEYAGVKFVNYQGYVGNTRFIDAKKAYVLPIGVPDLFQINYAPADSVETANTIGIKYYAKQERMPFGKGISIECQTNPLVLCTRPAALCEISMA